MLISISVCICHSQSSQGFIKAGGFKGVYKGISAAAIGSAPGGSSKIFHYPLLKIEICAPKF